MRLPSFFAMLLALPTCANEAAFVIADMTPESQEQEQAANFTLEFSANQDKEGENGRQLALDARLRRDIRHDLELTLYANSRHQTSRRQGDWDNRFSVNELYLSQTFGVDASADLGRVNLRHGVAIGYNPTDFFGEGASYSVNSGDIQYLRNHRQGNVMARWQRFWDQASLSLSLSPRLTAASVLRAGGSNASSRALLAFSYRPAENLNPQFLLFSESDHLPQWGLNISRVMNKGTVAYFEWAGGRQARQWQQGLPEARQSIAWRNRLSSGLTWSGEQRLSLTLEGEYNGAAEKQPSTGLAPGLEASLPTSQLQPLATLPYKAAAMVRLEKRGVLLDEIKLAGIYQREWKGNGKLLWLEANYQLKSMELSLQRMLYKLDASPVSSTAANNWRLAASLYF